MEQRLRPRSRGIVPLLRPQTRVPRERVQPRLREQHRECKVREGYCLQRADAFRILGHLVISLRLWEALGFTKAGLIPNAGRLKEDGGGEEYVDAIVFYKRFVEDGDQQ